MTIELFYEGGITTFELNTLPGLLHHLATRHPNCHIRVRSIEESPAGAKLSLAVDDIAPDEFAAVTADARRLHAIQTDLRRQTTMLAEFQKTISKQLNEVGRLLEGAQPQLQINAPVSGMVIVASGNSSVRARQVRNDSAAVKAVLSAVFKRRAELALDSEDADLLDETVKSTKKELGKPEPDPTVVSKGLKVVRGKRSSCFS